MNPALENVVNALSAAHADAMAFGAGGVADTLNAMQSLVYSLACESLTASGPSNLIELAAVALREASEQSGAVGSYIVAFEATNGQAVGIRMADLISGLQHAATTEPVR